MIERRLEYQLEDISSHTQRIEPYILHDEYISCMCVVLRIGPGGTWTALYGCLGYIFVFISRFGPRSEKKKLPGRPPCTPVECRNCVPNLWSRCKMKPASQSDYVAVSRPPHEWRASSTHHHLNLTTSSILPAVASPVPATAPRPSWSVLRSTANNIRFFAAQISPTRSLELPPNLTDRPRSPTVQPCSLPRHSNSTHN
ncbi:hypothetical protein BO94DRAFT_61693 [Aspergillus sclerotioniger CBS 115572]|uniref:Uncharacterized protein n=1 Tax=Aspergillus sclerotioniger CBS 115572 TaxID=1450535 RepID=A0A317WNI7_9EURO|nr:hypothetical protein BO94DRAFT_61693 [Aspergillus sclerotioniger CBS 115572]PWY88034.1 hypothetical protein BO94DRAFT_61693 [Aspergillus sclerotioniger CBS 115572]